MRGARVRDLTTMLVTQRLTGPAEEAAKTKKEAALFVSHPGSRAARGGGPLPQTAVLS